MTIEKVRTFKDLKVWQKSHEFVLSIYKTTESFPNDEKFGLISQLRRCAYSIPSNIVEGHARKSKKDFAHFLTVAKGSLEECKYFLLLSKDLGYISEKTLTSLELNCDEIGRMLYGFQTKLIA